MPARARGENLNGSGGVRRRISIGLAAPMAQINRKMKQTRNISFLLCGKYEMNRFKKRKRRRDLTKIFTKYSKKLDFNLATRESELLLAWNLLHNWANNIPEVQEDDCSRGK